MWTSRSCRLVIAIAMVACQSRQPGAHKPSADGPVAPIPAGGEAVFDLPSVIQGIVRVPSHRRVRVLDDVVIGIGGRLELGPGDTVVVASGKGLYVKGGELLAKGTPDGRIVFTSLAPKPQPGDWSGVVFDWVDLPPRPGPDPWPPSNLEHVVIEFAGRPWIGLGKEERAGGLSIQGHLGSPRHVSSAGRIALSSVEFRNNAARGLDVRSDAPLSWKDLKFGSNGGASALIDIALVDHLGTSPTEAVELVGDVRSTMQLPKRPTPYVVVESLFVGSFDLKTPAVLTIAPGTILKFKAGQGLAVGDHFAGRLVAHGVNFTSAAATPASGDWSGIRFGELSSADLDGDTFEYAGGDPRYVLGWSSSAERRVDIRRSTFRKNAAPAFFSCPKWGKDARGNVSEGQPLCRRKK